MFIPYQDFVPVLDNLAQFSIEENFQDEGRFGNGILGGGNTHWERSRRAKIQSGRTLQDTGQLAASIRVRSFARGGITIDSNGETFTIITDGGFGIDAGSNKPYARIHQEGGTISHPGGTPYIVTAKGAVFISKKKAAQLRARKRPVPVYYTKPHKITILRRPFLVLQDADVLDMQAEFAKWLERKVM